MKRLIASVLVGVCPLIAQAGDACGVFTGQIVVEGMTCSPLRVLGAQPQQLCQAEFDFRSDAARDEYVRISAEMLKCFGKEAQREVGPAVNHPDSYDQTVFEVDGEEISVALKDKGALQKTYVFLRVPAR